MKYYFQKQCKHCQNIFYSKPIGEEEYNALLDNPAIQIGYAPDECLMILQSDCGCQRKSSETK